MKKLSVKDQYEFAQLFQACRDLTMIKRLTQSKPLAKALDLAIANERKPGKKQSDALAETGAFGLTLTRLIGFGEITGQTEGLLQGYVTAIRNELTEARDKTKTFCALFASLGLGLGLGYLLGRK